MLQTLSDQLDEKEQQLGAALADAVLGVERIADAVLRPEQLEARRLCDEGARLKRACRRIEVELIGIAAREAPVSIELHVVVAMIQIAQHGALVGNQFGLTGEQLLSVDPAVHDRRGTAGKVNTMAFLAAGQLASAAGAYARRDASVVEQLERQDDRIDRLNREVFAAAQQLEVSSRRRELALRHVLIARSLERIGDNSVKIAEHAAVVAAAADSPLLTPSI